MAREIAIRDVAASCSLNGDDYLDLCAFTLALDGTEVGREAELDTTLTERMADCKTALLSTIEEWARLTRLELPARVNSALSAQMAAWHSSLRLFGPFDDIRRFGYAAYGFYRYLCALSAYRQSLPPPMAMVQLFSALRPLLFHLANLARRPRAIGEIGEPETSGFSLLPMAVQAGYATICNRIMRPEVKSSTSAPSWGELLLAARPESALDAILWLRCLANGVEKKVAWQP
jgi:hypothetical protein